MFQFLQIDHAELYRIGMSSLLRWALVAGIICCLGVQMVSGFNIIPQAALPCGFGGDRGSLKRKSNFAPGARALTGFIRPPFMASLSMASEKSLDKIIAEVLIFVLYIHFALRELGG